MSRPTVLYICIHNSARSQIAEELTRKYGGDLLEAESAGLEPGELNPAVVRLLREDGIDISGKKTRSVFDLKAEGRSYDYVVAVCDPEAQEGCPIFPAEKARLHWPFADPSKATGSLEERTAAIRPIYESIRERVRRLVDDYRKTGRFE